MINKNYTPTCPECLIEKCAGCGLYNDSVMLTNSLKHYTIKEQIRALNTMKSPASRILQHQLETELIGVNN